MSPIVASTILLVSFAVVAAVSGAAFAGGARVVSRMFAGRGLPGPASSANTSPLRLGTITAVLLPVMWLLFFTILRTVPQLPAEPSASFLQFLPFATFLGVITGMSLAIVYLFRSARSRSEVR